ncbi:MAG: O-antigen ligase family protein [Thiofilum sp.]|uniref:O-antigen ligase family protein n=1 Tax=Thiofilum sp. TaxID=2212733 RepID=UPI0025D00A57|nr:O-antigen ligase family protein [Thiofilum sp.]MBK8452411.1 O-antigen ligase family protein [Thiofilum sp.]
MKNKIFSYLESDKTLIIIMTLCLTSLSVMPFLIEGSFHDSQRLISIFIILILSYKTVYTGAIAKTSTYIILALAISGFISSVLSIIPYWSMIELLLLISLVILIVNFQVENYSFLAHKITLLFCFLQLIYIFRALINYSIVLIRSDPLDINMIIDGFSNLRFYGQFISWTLPFIVAYTCVNKDKNNKYLLFTTMLSTGLVLLSGTRAFFVGMLFSIVSTYFFVPTLWKSYTLAILKVLLGGMVFYITTLFIIPFYLNIDNSLLLNSSINRDLTNSSGRSEIWLTTLKVFIEYPYFGIGPMMLALDGIYSGVAHPHNMFLQILSEWGVIFSLIFLTILYKMISSWKNLIQQNAFIRAPIALGITASISSAFMVSLVDGIIVMPVSIIYLGIIVGLGSAVWKHWTPQETSIKLSYSLKILLYTPIILLTIISAQQWLNLEQFDTNASRPRFWQHGTLAKPSHIEDLPINW